MKKSDEKQASLLWDKLHSYLVNSQKVIEEIIEKRAWEPLGYSTFFEAWNDRMGDITLATEIRPHVVYQMISEGASDEQVADAVKGISERLPASLRRQRSNGVPPSAADMSTVRQHLRKKPSRADTLHLKIGTTRLARYQVIADRHGKSVAEIALEAIESRFLEL